MTLEIATDNRRRNYRPTITSPRVGSCGWSEGEGLLGRDHRCKVFIVRPGRDRRLGVGVTSGRAFFFARTFVAPRMGPE
jgi:hypothetical protein